MQYFVIYIYQQSIKIDEVPYAPNRLRMAYAVGAVAAYYWCNRSKGPLSRARLRAVDHTVCLHAQSVHLPVSQIRYVMGAYNTRSKKQDENDPRDYMDRMF